jgi:hypothetical protein
MDTPVIAKGSALGTKLRDFRTELGEDFRLSRVQLQLAVFNIRDGLLERGKQAFARVSAQQEAFVVRQEASPPFVTTSEFSPSQFMGNRSAVSMSRRSTAPFRWNE